jgi:hypothetical protein
VATAWLQVAITSLVRLVRPRRAGSGSGTSWLAAICREVAHVMPSYAVTPCSRAISASPCAHGDHAGRTGQCWVCGRDLARNVRDIDGSDHAEMEAFERPLQIDAVSDLVRCGPSGWSACGCRYCCSDLACSAGQCWVGAAVWAG